MASQSQLYSALRAVGMSDAHAKIGAAVGMAESGGNLSAHNGVPPDDSYGPWQINMIGSLGPARRAAYGLKSNTDLYDLVTSARVTKAISHNGSDWGPWSTFKNGSYLRFMSNAVSSTGANNAGLNLPSIPGIPGLGTISDIKGIYEAVTKTAQWVSNAHNWVRVGYVIGGGVVVIVALDMYLSNSSVARSVSKFGAAAVTKIPV